MMDTGGGGQQGECVLKDVCCVYVCTHVPVCERDEPGKCVGVKRFRFQSIVNRNPEDF